MDCPRCGLINPETAQRCDCGYDFTTKTLEEPYDRSQEDQRRPWVRYWARMMDVMLFGLPCGIIIGFIHEPLLELPDVIFGIIIMFLYVFVEPIMLSAWGTTPGKALLNVRLRKADGDKLSYGEALRRSVNVWVRGLGLGIPIVSLFTLMNAYNRLAKEGMTSWDEEGDFRILHRLVGAGRVILTVIVFSGYVFLIALGEADI